MGIHPDMTVIWVCPYVWGVTPRWPWFLLENDDFYHGVALLHQIKPWWNVLDLDPVILCHFFGPENVTKSGKG